MLTQFNCLILIDWLWSKMPIAIVLNLATLSDMKLTHFFLFSCCLVLLLLIMRAVSASEPILIYIVCLVFFIISRKHDSYMDNFKLQVIAFTKRLNNSMAACHFTVNEEQVQKWKKVYAFYDYFSSMFSARNLHLYISRLSLFQL